MGGQLFVTKVCDLTIKLGDQYSKVMWAEETTGDADTLLITAPVDLDDDTPFQIQVSVKRRATFEDAFVDLYDANGEPIYAPTRGRAREYIRPAWVSWRIKAGAAVGRDTTFGISKSHFV